jgi:DNA polymerase-3 subunit delta
MAKEIYTFETICAGITARKFAPVYLLIGEEPYFIDKITDLLIDNVLPEDVRAFDQLVLYGADTKVADIFNAARQFPSMMSERRLVVVREAQLVNNLEQLAAYAKNPLSSTVLVISHKYKKFDRKKALAVAVEKNGILFNSEKIRDYNMPVFIRNMLKDRGVEADAKVVSMLADHLGNDLALLHKELDKLLILLSDMPVKRITPEIVETNVGISKDYNNYELVSAIAVKDILKANRIVQYFDRNPKEHSIQTVLASLFNYFTNLLICHYEKDKSENNIMQLFNLRFPIQTKDYKEGLRRFSALKVFNIIHDIRIAEARSKGIDATSNMENGDNMKELLYKILH